MVKMVNFMLCMFFHEFFKKELHFKKQKVMWAAVGDSGWNSESRQAMIGGCSGQGEGMGDGERGTVGDMVWRRD